VSFGDLPFLKPTIKLTNPRVQFAVYGHIISNIGGFFMIIAGLMTLFDKPAGAIIGILGGIFILIVELDRVQIPQLKDALNRGLAWILLAAFSFGIEFLAIVLTLIGGAFYLAYHYQ
jgi:hypothetical protein